jgi:fluoride ion exporter CrcB/FEX
VVFLTATMLSVQHWPADAYLFALATLGYGCALGGYTARRFRQDPRVRRLVGKQWVVAHIVGMIGSYTVLWTAFYVDNAHLIPGLKELPTLTFWVFPTVIALPFLVMSLSRFAPKTVRPHAIRWRAKPMSKLREAEDEQVEGTAEIDA